MSEKPELVPTLTGYGECRCILSQYCDGTCSPIYVMKPKPAAPQNDESQNVARIEWDGEGFPPAGTTCELRVKNGGWGNASIKYMSKTQCVWLWINENPDQIEYSREPWKMEFRQIRTPEQIAQQERQAAIEEMDAVFSSNFEGHRKDGLQALYDAGYRKQVAP